MILIMIHACNTAAWADKSTWVPAWITTLLLLSNDAAVPSNDSRNRATAIGLPEGD